ncbi:MAG: Ig-like domain-containing protein, partial [Stackebrandtia sp.]
VAAKLSDDHARHRRIAITAASLVGAVLLAIGVVNAPQALRDNFPIPSFGQPVPSASTPAPAVTSSQFRSPSPKPRKKRPPKHHGGGDGGGKTGGGNPGAKAPDRARGADNSTPVLTFLSPAKGEEVSGTVTIRVKVSNPSRLAQVDFHQLTLRCDDDDDTYKEYIGNDKTPDANGVYTFRFDTDEVDNGCLHFGAVGLDKHDPDDTLYPEEGVYRRVYVDN